MNKVILKGRLTRDPEIRYTAGDEKKAVAKFSVAVDRPRKKDAESQADFIPITCFGKTAEMIEKYFRKGQEILLEGRWQTGSYEKDGKKVYTNDCIADHIYFCGKKTDGTVPAPEPQPDEDGFMSIPDGIDEELPFN